MTKIALLLLKKFWKELAIIIIVAGLSYKTYDYVYDKATVEANKECTKTMKEYTDGLDKRIESLVALSIANSKANEDLSNLLKQDLDKILKAAKAKPLTIIKEGKCLPSDNFVNSYNEAIDRINSR